jgi:hypothetical protein
MPAILAYLDNEFRNSLCKGALNGKSPRRAGFFFSYSLSSEYQVELKIVPTMLAWKGFGMNADYFGEPVET